MATDTNDFICDTCRKIDFRDLIQTKGEYKGKALQIVQYSLGCKVCEILFEEMIGLKKINDFEYKKGGIYTYEVQSMSFKKNSAWAPEVSNSWDDSTLVWIKEATPFMGCSRSSFEITSCRLVGDGLHGPCCAELVADVWDSDKARS